MFNDLSDPKTYIATRRSARPREMTGPLPDAETLREIMRMATRTPDHGKLAPWRFLAVGANRRADFGDLLGRAFAKANPGASEVQAEAATQMARYESLLVVALFSPRESAKIPLWEQQLSCGAACMNLVHAAHVHGFVAGWITGWASYDETVRKALCANDSERIAGFIHIGSQGAELSERDRPDTEDVIATWEPSAA